MSSDDGEASATSTAPSAGFALSRAKNMVTANEAILKELELLHSDEHVRRAHLITIDYPLARRWSEEADLFLQQMAALEENHAGIDGEDERSHGTRKLVAKRVAIFDETVGKSIEQLEALAVERATTVSRQLL